MHAGVDAHRVSRSTTVVRNVGYGLSRLHAVHAAARSVRTQSAFTTHAPFSSWAPVGQVAGGGAASSRDGAGVVGSATRAGGRPGSGDEQPAAMPSDQAATCINTAETSQDDEPMGAITIVGARAQDATPRAGIQPPRSAEQPYVDLAFDVGPFFASP